MKKLLLLPLLAAALAGCCSYTEIGRVKEPLLTDDGETPLATVTVFNISYSLFGLLPIESGTTWKDGPYDQRDSWNATWFEDRCTLDENLASVKAAMREIGSSRVLNLTTESDSWRFWSLYIVKRKIMKSSCTVLKPKTAAAAK